MVDHKPMGDITVGQLAYDALKSYNVPVTYQAGSMQCVLSILLYCTGKSKELAHCSIVP